MGPSDDTGASSEYKLEVAVAKFERGDPEPTTIANPKLKLNQP